jgi:hypothetical protein
MKVTIVNSSIGTHDVVTCGVEVDHKLNIVILNHSLSDNGFVHIQMTIDEYKAIIERNMDFLKQQVIV